MKAKKSAFQLGGYEVTTNINQHNAEYPWPSSDVNIDGDMDRDVNSACKALAIANPSMDI